MFIISYIGLLIRRTIFYLLLIKIYFISIIMKRD